MLEIGIITSLFFAGNVKWFLKDLEELWLGPCIQVEIYSILAMHWADQLTTVISVTPL